MVVIIPRKLLVVDRMLDRWRWQTYVHRLLRKQRKRRSNLSSLLLSGAELWCKWLEGIGWEGRLAANLKDKRETRNTRLQAIT
jgi:hypothetical protein